MLLGQQDLHAPLRRSSGKFARQSEAQYRSLSRTWLIFTRYFDWSFLVYASASFASLKNNQTNAMTIAAPSIVLIISPRNNRRTGTISFTSKVTIEFLNKTDCG